MIHSNIYPLKLRQTLDFMIMCVRIKITSTVYIISICFRFKHSSIKKRLKHRELKSHGGNFGSRVEVRYCTLGGNRILNKTGFHARITH